MDQTPPTFDDFNETSAASITNVVLSGAGNRTIQVFFDAPLIAGETVTLLANSIANTTGDTGPAANVTATVTDQTAPTFDSVTAAAAGTYEVTATFSEDLLCTSVDLTDFTVTVDGGARAVTGIDCTTHRRAGDHLRWFRHGGGADRCRQPGRYRYRPGRQRCRSATSHNDTV